MNTFEHGGQIDEFVKDINCDIKEVIDLSSNINFIKPDVHLNFNNLDISSYPIYDNLYKKIANTYKINPEQLELFNGGSSAIFALFKHLDLKHCTIYSPAYLEYKKACVNFGYELRTINRFENMNLPVKNASLVIFVNPSTPDGTYYDIDVLMEYWMDKDCVILIDESFLDFCDGESAIRYLEKYDKLYILKSMTKFYSSAGIRVGTIVSNEKNIDSLKRFEPMWKLSIFDTNYLSAALEDRNFKRISKAINIKNRLELENILENCNCIESIYQSSANYILAKLKNIKANELQEKLKPYKIMIRNCENFDFLDNTYVRIAVKSSTKLKILKQALKEIC